MNNICFPSFPKFSKMQMTIIKQNGNYYKEINSLVSKKGKTSILLQLSCNQIRSDQSLSRVRLFATPWIAARQASLFITNSQSSLRLTSIESVMPSSHLILCRPLLLLPPIPPSVRVFSNESTFRIRWPKYWSFSFSIIPSKEIPGLLQNGLVGSPCSPRDSQEFSCNRVF